MSVELVEVRIEALPLDVYRRTQEHHDELFREFALMQIEASTAPLRLLGVVDELDGRFGGFTAATTAELDEALARGDATVDLVFRVPAEAGSAARRLGDLLDEADEYCRSGDLLTLETPPEAAAFRRWYLEEFARQAEGQPPTRWGG